MKELTMYIRAEKLETMKNILVDKHKCGGMTVSNVMGCGNQQGFVDEFRGTRTNVNLLPKLKVEVVVEDEKVEKIVEDVCNNISTGLVGDGKIFIKNIEEAIRIRTGEHGDSAV